MSLLAGLLHTELDGLGWRDTCRGPRAHVGLRVKLERPYSVRTRGLASAELVGSGSVQTARARGLCSLPQTARARGAGGGGIVSARMSSFFAPS